MNSKSFYEFKRKDKIKVLEIENENESMKTEEKIKITELIEICSKNLKTQTK